MESVTREGALFSVRMMENNRITNRINLSLIALIIPVLMFAPMLSILSGTSMSAQPAEAALSASQLQKQREQLAAQAAAARAAAAQAAATVAAAKQQAVVVQGQITKTENSIADTENKIGGTQAVIDDLATKIKTEEENLANEKNKLNNVVSEWYMEGQDGLLATMIGATNLSDVVARQQYYDSIKQQISLTMDRLRALQADLENQKSENYKQLLILQGMRTDQVNQQKNLEYQKAMKDKLASNATAAMADYQSQAADAEKKMKEIQAQIDALIATKSWGGDVISSNDGSWYYSQLDYPNDKLGPSPYSIALYGCLITSLAMVATYYGNRVTPPQAVDQSNFNYEGYLLSTSIVKDSGSQTVNWGTIDDELANGHPVIVGVYMSSVGSLGNSYGVSHFVVIKGKSGDKYLMHDPLGAGRGYTRSQVRAMRIIRP